MLKQRRKMAWNCHLISMAAIITAVLMMVSASGSYAQYNGECWAADYYNVLKIDLNGQAVPFQGFSQPLSLSINPGDGSVWIADTDAIKVRKLSAAGQELLVLDGAANPPAFKTQPASVAVDTRDGSCWVATKQSVYKFSADGNQLAKLDGFSEPSVAVSPLNGDCWVADSNKARVVRISEAGQQLAAITIEGVTQPKSISVNPTDGTCWVLDPFTQKVVKLSADGAVLIETTAVPAGSAMMLTFLSASLDGGCWVAVMIDTMNDSVVKLSADGKQALKVDGFAMPSGLAADPRDGGCWVADTNGGKVTKLSAAGQTVASIGGLTYPKVVAVVSQAR